MFFALTQDVVLLVKRDGASCYQVGLDYLSGAGRLKSRTVARIFLRCAAKRNIAPAAGILGDTYVGGRTSNGARKAIKWYTKCAELGDPLGQHRMGWALLHLEGVERDVEKAKQRLTLAAENGVEEAAEELVLINQDV